MKKILALLTAALMLAVMLCACSAGGAKVKVIDIALSEEAYAFCVNKADADLLAQVNAYLAQIKEDGTFDEICDKYFGNGTPAQITSAAEDASKDQLVVATSTGFEPFEMVDGSGKFSGVDLEIAAGLAAYLNKELVIKDMKFESVVTSVQQGLCDIGMAGLTITPAREEVVTFSDSYYSANQVLVVPADNTEFDACKTADDVVAILNAKTADCKIGCQNGTTGAIYIEGDSDDPEGYGFAGLPATKMGYDYAALAMTAMTNGEIDYVIVDNAPANAIAKSING
ncbi:MAG: transporter substrate-binding domain-containing protein [Ruminococcaceae bacterium]|nr:transporter substrate-binding domain-containing protein [Oscillospiraceae bacterium]